MKTKTATYITEKLDRSTTPTETTTEIVLRKVKKAAIHIGQVLASMLENGQKQIIRIEGERMKHIIEVSRRKQSKPKSPSDLIREATYKQEWEYYLLKSGKW